MATRIGPNKDYSASGCYGHSRSVYNPSRLTLAQRGPRGRGPCVDGATATHLRVRRCRQRSRGPQRPASWPSDHPMFSHGAPRRLGTKYKPPPQHYWCSRTEHTPSPSTCLFARGARRLRDGLLCDTHPAAPLHTARTHLSGPSGKSGLFDQCREEEMVNYRARGASPFGSSCGPPIAQG